MDNLRNKTRICFTWDDNFIRHHSVIAPLFEKYGLKCSFFINSDDENLNEYMSLKYKDLFNRGFEIGSHGFKHINMLKIPEDDFYKNIQLSQNMFMEKLGIYPKTFAFPYHKYNIKLVNIAKRTFLETRNTLINSIRFSLKTSTYSYEMTNKLEEVINTKKTLIISGHSVISKQEKIMELEQGYEPVVLEELEEFISNLYKYPVSVETFCSIVMNNKNE